MSTTLKWKKIAAGHYRTTDNDFEIREVKSQQTGRRTEVVWEITARGNVLPYCEDTLRSAKDTVSRYY